MKFQILEPGSCFPKEDHFGVVMTFVRTNSHYIALSVLISYLDTWGFADVGAAIDAIPSWVQTMEWKGPGVDIHHWMVIGHSNGGKYFTRVS